MRRSLSLLTVGIANAVAISASAVSNPNVDIFLVVGVHNEFNLPEDHRILHPT